MSDQCPSTTGSKAGAKAQPKHRERTPMSLVGAGGGVRGRSYWRSLDELSDTPKFRDWLEREFPAKASELLEGSRRTFLKLMGASLALAGAATMPGCRRPDHKIYTYSKDVPEDTIPGKPKYFATSMPLSGGGAEGLLVESHENRPTKIEGNPLHPVNRGRTSPWAQAEVLRLYDPDRLKDPFYAPGLSPNGTQVLSWEFFAGWARDEHREPQGEPSDELQKARQDARDFWAKYGQPGHFNQFDASRGRGLAFIVDRKMSPSRAALRQQVREKWPDAEWVSYDPVAADEQGHGLFRALGGPAREVLSLDKADVVISLDRDFLLHDPMGVANARNFASKRRVLKPGDKMNRLYVLEPGFSITGAKADHRMRLAPSLVAVAAVMLAKEILAAGGAAPELSAALGRVSVPAVAAIDAKWIKAAAEDLVKSGAAGVVVAGPSQPREIHALVCAINHAIGAVGTTVRYIAGGLPEEVDSGARKLVELSGLMAAGAINTVVCIESNPVHNAPADADFAAAFAKVPNRLTLSIGNSETADASTWRLPCSHFLEAWGDTEAWDGTIAPVQPLIAPLYASKSDIELLAILLGLPSYDGHELVRGIWEPMFGANFEKTWRRALHDGVAAGIPAPAAMPGANVAVGAAAMLATLKLGSGPTDSAFDAVFTTWNIQDGRYANAGWMQELPDPATKIVWDNAALLSPATAKRLGLLPEKETVEKRAGRMATVTIGGKSMDIVAWVLPGMADNTVILPMGYGRKVCGLVADGAGFNVDQIRSAADRRMATGVEVSASTGTPRLYNITTTQQHGTMEGRAILREVDLPAWDAHGGKPFPRHDHFKNTFNNNFAEELGEMSHAPLNKSIYTHPYNLSPEGPDGTKRDAKGKPPAYSTGPQWAMTIDLATCTGCGACTIACQSENNIPVAGKIEVNKHREMHWIRIDRYFVNEAHPDEGNPAADSPEDPNLGMAFQPVACVQCENAPCETVCPVNATVHGPEGINYMAYNRCIGTRYCANNCPYKVRRFNFFDFGVTKYQGGLTEPIKETIGDPPLPKNHNLIPPRLRAKLDEISKMQKNPDVTVRSRGVMEKCTYCIQRINDARVTVKLQNLEGIPDGMVQTACQQVCPSEAITFGDQLDPNSRVKAMRDNARSYLLLGSLNTRPRTSHMLSVRNPNPAIRQPVVDPFHGHEHEGHGHEEHAAAMDEIDGGRRIALKVLSGGRA